MRKTRLRKNNGITLIALVITIIVLLILAGVAISMLSGENGILNKAKEAKEKTEEGQKQEETALIDYELDMHFITNNSKYKCRYGFVTGVAVNNDKVTDKVSDLQAKLPDGYTVCDKDENAITGTDPLLSTGMTIKKDGTTVARVVVYGDTNGDTSINTGDNRLIIDIKQGVTAEDYVIMSADVNHDGVINDNDVMSDFKIEQNAYVSDLDTLLSETDKNLVNKYVQLLKEKLKSQKIYSIEYIQDDEIYVLKGASSETKVKDILGAFGNDPKIIIKHNSVVKDNGETPIEVDDEVCLVNESDNRVVILMYVDNF